MDYGKLAYLRQEEMKIEADLASQSGQGGQISKRSVNIFRRVRGKNRIKLFSAKGSFLLNLTLFGGENGSKVSLFADSKRVASADYANNLSFSVTLENGAVCVLEVGCSTAFGVERAEIMVLSGAVDDPNCGFGVAKVGKKAGFCRIVGGQIRFSVIDDVFDSDGSGSGYGSGSGDGSGSSDRLNFEEGIVLFDESNSSDYLLLGFGASADISACKYANRECFCVACVDNASNAYLVFADKIDGEYVIFGIEFVGANTHTISVGFCDGELFCGTSQRGYGVIKSVFDKDFAVISDCDDVRIIKGSNPPMVVSSFGGKNTLRVCVEELFGHRDFRAVAEVVRS